MSRTLAELGFTEELARAMPDEPGLSPARVASVYSARVETWSPDGEHLASLRGKVLKGEAPVGGVAVGDWVALSGTGADVVVEHVLPRRTAFIRQAAGERAEPQAICANVDRVFVVTSFEGDFNVRRIERYLVAIRAGGAEPFLVLTKADLVDDTSVLVEEASRLAPVTITSIVDGRGLDALVAAIPPGITAAFAGSSGVGKSALVNRLLGKAAQEIGDVRSHDKRGRHTTTRRALFSLPSGGLVVDTPGMRELKPWQPEGEASLEVFDDLEELAAQCRFGNCRHAAEPGCAVREAMDAGTVDADRVASFVKLRAEREAGESRQSQFATHQAKRAQARVASVALRKRVREKG